MTYQTITLNVPETVYQQIRRAAEKIRRPLNDILAGIPSMKWGGEVRGERVVAW